MKKLNRKGFTLIELLAVITIMGILMLVAIPAVSRTIENSRRDTFMDTAKSYMNAIKNAVAADELYYVPTGTTDSSPISAAPAGYYYYGFDSSNNTGTDLMEQGGRSSWGNAHVKGYVAIHKTVTEGTEGRTKYEYAVRMIDAAKRGITALTPENQLKRSSVKTTSGVDGVTAPANTDNDKFGETGEKLNSTGTSANCTALSIG